MTMAEDGSNEENELLNQYIFVVVVEITMKIEFNLWRKLPFYRDEDTAERRGSVISAKSSVKIEKICL